MSIEQTDVIDFIGTDKQSGRVVLTISDHLPWTPSSEHFSLLEQKIGAYLRFVTSGQLVESRPDSEGREIEFRVVAAHEPSAEARQFLEAVRRTLEPKQVLFSFGTIPAGS